VKERSKSEILALDERPASEKTSGRPVSGVVPRAVVPPETAAALSRVSVLPSLPSLDGSLPDPRRAHAVGISFMLVAAVLWSTGGVGIKVLHLPSLSLAGWRACFALPVLALLLATQARAAGPVSRAALRSPWPWAAGIACTVKSVAFVVATKLTTSASAVFIQYTAPVYVALLSWPLLRERVTWRHGLACAGVVVGMLFVFRDAITPDARIGNAVALLASFAGAAMPLALRADQRALARRGAARAAQTSPALAIAAGNVLGIVACAPAMLASPPHGAFAWAVIAALGVGQIGLAYVFFTLAVPRLTALETALVPALEPVLMPIWVLLAMGERPGSSAVVGALFILASVLFPSLKR
jgi:drug/metabolite transporter (DMT)-like permease